MPRCFDHADLQPTYPNRVALSYRHMLIGCSGQVRRVNLSSSPARQFHMPGNKVRVRVCFQNRHNPEPLRLRRRQILIHVPSGIRHCRLTIRADEIRRMRQSL